MNKGFKLFVLFLFWLNLVKSGFEVDVIWEFDTDGDTAGWGEASVAESDMSVSAFNGTLICSISGSFPYLDSPSLFLTITPRHFVVIRMKYSGVSSTANLLLRSGVAQNGQAQIDANTQYWTARQQMTITSDSGSSRTLYKSANVVDDNPTTYWNSTTKSAAYIIFDLGDYRTITSLRINPIGGTNSPRRCFLQRSITGGIGPFTSVISFTVPSSSSPAAPTTTVNGFSGLARYWKLLILDNYGGDSIGIRDFYLDGYDDSVTVVPFAINNAGG
jgi:hypothetical protein